MITKPFEELFDFLPKSKRQAGVGVPSGNFPFYTSSNELTKYIDDYDYSGNCLIFGTGGNPSVHYQSRRFSTSTDCLVARPKNSKEISAEYCYLYLTGNMCVIEAGFHGAGLKHISKGYISKIKIPLPPLDDQIRIATVLTRAERLIAKRKESIKALDELLKSTFLEMFGDHESMLKQPKTKLNDFIVFLTSGSRGWAQHYTETGDVFLRINNVRNASLKLDDLIYVNPPDNAEALRTKVRTNDLLFSITADIGRTAVVPEALNGAFINQHLALIRLNQMKIHPLFVAWFFAMPYGKSIVMKKNREGVKAGLNFDDIRGFDLVVPPLPLQNQFAAIVEKVESIKAKQTQSLAELENLYASLSQRAFKGELDFSLVWGDVEPATVEEHFPFVTAELTT